MPEGARSDEQREDAEGTRRLQGEVGLAGDLASAGDDHKAGNAAFMRSMEQLKKGDPEPGQDLVYRQARS